MTQNSPVRTFENVSLAELSDVAQEIIDTRKYPILLFIGELGAGKTTLIKELLTKLGSKDLGSSPSYALINKYALESGNCYHMDLYRLNTAEEAFALGLEEILYGGETCFVEWPELVLDYLQPPYNVLKLEVGEQGRQIKLYEVN